MGPNYIALAVPFFFALIAVELWLARGRGQAVYRFADAVADIGCGITQRILLLFFEATLLLAYVQVYRHARVVDLGVHPIASWAVAFVWVDFSYYWWHRASHRVNALWAAHVVHHQSEALNLAVALRQSVLTPVTALPFALPLAIVGIPPLVWGACGAISLLYQFWIHTALVRTLGPLETVLNSPSHHRVHHARNPQYLDRNYGAIFIVWDRLFGTYQPERAPPEYGITRPLRSFNALWAQVQPLAALWALARRAPRLRDRISVWLAPPERAFAWDRGGYAGSGDPPYDIVVAPAVRTYVLVNVALAVCATTALMLFAYQLPAAPLVAGAGLVLLTVLTGGGLVERRRWARPAEVTRLVGVVALVVWWSAR
jgi:alkylglycerol monooxygenase